MILFLMLSPNIITIKEKAKHNIANSTTVLLYLITLFIKVFLFLASSNSLGELPWIIKANNANRKPKIVPEVPIIISTSFSSFENMFILNLYNNMLLHNERMIGPHISKCFKSELAIEIHNLFLQTLILTYDFFLFIVDLQVSMRTFCF